MVLPLMSGRSSGGKMIQRVADLAFNEAALFLDHENERLPRANFRSPSVSNGQVIPIL